MKLKEIVDRLNDFAPFALQEGYDNSGIQIGDPQSNRHRGLICLDVTEKVLDEAISKGCDLIVSHHPLLFEGLKRITGHGVVDKVVVKAIRQDIAIVSVHTNLDNISKGVNKKLAEAIGLKDLKILSPRKGLLQKLVTFCPENHADKVRSAIFEAGAGQIGEYDCCSFNVIGNGTFRGSDDTNPFVGEKGKLHFEPETRIETILPVYLVPQVLKAMLNAHPYEEVAYDIYALDNTFSNVGAGMIGLLEAPVTEIELLLKIKEALRVPFLRHSEFTGRMVQRIAVCGGSGSFLRQQALNSGADVFISADIKYHDFIGAQSRILLVDAGHYETEQFTKELLHEILTKKITNFALLISEQDINPVKYL